MNQNKTNNKNHPLATQNKYPRSKRLKIITLLSFAAYFLIFLLLLGKTGRAISIGTVIPILTVGWFYGFIPAVCTYFLFIPINILLYLTVGASYFNDSLFTAPGFGGSITLLICGAVVGKMRDLSVELKNTNIQLSEEISARKKAAQETVKANKYFQNMIDTSPDPIVITDETGHINRANKAFHSMLGYTEGSLIGKHIYDLSWKICGYP